MKRAMLLLIAGTLAGCSGSAGTSAIPRPQDKTAAVAFTMKWPAKNTTSTRRPNFVSPSTASVIVEVNGDPAYTTFANAPQNGAASSTVNINAPVGQDTFVISLYDQAQTAGETSAAGNELGQATISQTIAAGTTNVVNATIDGIVARVTVAPAANQPFVQSLPSGGFAIVGDAPQIFTATALDAGGNVIVPAPAVNITVPTYGNNPPSGSTYFAVAPVTGHADEFAINATMADQVGNFFVNTTMTASAKDAVGNTASTTYPLLQSDATYVSYGSGPAGTPLIALFDGSGNIVPLAPAAFAGLQNPAGIAYDPADHRVFVADTGLQQLLAFNADGTPVANFPFIKIAGVNGVAYDPNNGLVYVTGAAEVDSFTTAGKAVSNAGFGYTSHPSSVAYVSGPYICVGSADSGNVDVYDESGNWIQTFTEPYTAIAGMAPDHKVNMLFVAGQPSRGTSGVRRSYADGSNATAVSVTDPHGIAYDDINARILVVSRSANAIVPVSAWPGFGPVDTAGIIATPVSSGLSQPSGIAITF